MGGDKRRWHKITLVVPPPWKEVLPHFLEEMGFSGLWLDEERQPPHRLILRAYLKEGLWQPGMQEQLRVHLKELSCIFPVSRQEPELHIGLIDEEDWASKWLPFFQPLKIGPVWIRPSTRSVPPSAHKQEIILDPGQAFGTGHHESTQLCLESILLLRPFLEDGTRILDLGTGSGILAMFAAKIGFRNVVALDVDHVATETAVRNISANGLQDSIEVRNESIESAEERFGLILANLSAPLLQNLAEELRLHLDKHGRLVAGGYLSGETNTLIQTFRATGLELTHRKTKNDWGCLILQLRQP
ncbi:MAG: 50S ribosomal protein L11 methyltransferase [Deltaproteobacteria bacterium]|nr:50S ribosomal protein L11 methyltransferase [Deltaproteobacteria bacterium]